MPHLYVYSLQEEYRPLAELFVDFLLKHDLILRVPFIQHGAKDLTIWTLFPLALRKSPVNVYHLINEVSGPKEVNYLSQVYMEVNGNAGI